MSITNSTRYTIKVGKGVTPAVYGDWIYIVPAMDVVQNLGGSSIALAIDSVGGFLLPFGAMLSTLRKDNSRAQNVSVQNNGAHDVVVDVVSGIGPYQPPVIDYFAHEDATANLAELVAIDGHLVAGVNLAHTDAGVLHADLGTVATNTAATASNVATAGTAAATAAGVAHADALDVQDAVGVVATNIGISGTAAHADAVVAHDDALDIETALGTVAGNVATAGTAAHTDAGTAHDDALDIETALGVVAGNVATAGTAAATAAGTAHTDAEAVAAAIVASPYLPIPAATAGPVSGAHSTPGAFSVGLGTVHAPALKLVAGFLMVLGGASVQGKAYLKVTKATGGAVLIPLAVVSPSPLVAGFAILPNPILLEDLDVLTLEQDAGAAACQFEGIIA